MKTKIVKIGNSRGIRIPKSLIEESGLEEEVELELKEESILLKPIRKPRENWEEKFKKMAKAGDDYLLDEKYLHKQSSWDEEEWEW